MPHFQIKNHLTGAVLFEGEFGTMRLCVESAVTAGARLNYASLNDARLNGARLDGARLNYASLNYASLDGASLNYASLDGARLNGASLDGARLNYASLNYASLDRASLDGASLNYASLDGARLVGARLDGARLDGARIGRASLDGASLVGTRLDGARLRLGVKIRALRKVCFRTDGYEFRLWDCADGVWRITAGCRFFTLPEAWAHWTATRDNTPLGEETYDILVMFEHQAKRDDAARRIA